MNFLFLLQFDTLGAKSSEQEIEEENAKNHFVLRKHVAKKVKPNNNNNNRIIFSDFRIANFYISAILTTHTTQPMKKTFSNYCLIFVPSFCWKQLNGQLCKPPGIQQWKNRPQHHRYWNHRTNTTTTVFGHGWFLTPNNEKMKVWKNEFFLTSYAISLLANTRAGWGDNWVGSTYLLFWPWLTCCKDRRLVRDFLP